MPKVRLPEDRTITPRGIAGMKAGRMHPIYDDCTLVRSLNCRYFDDVELGPCLLEKFTGLIKLPLSDLLGVEIDGTIYALRIE